jgi:hypothetical protein
VTDAKSDHRFLRIDGTFVFDGEPAPLLSPLKAPPPSFYVEQAVAAERAEWTKLLADLDAASRPPIKRQP